MPDYGVFNLGDVVPQRGATLRDAKLGYKTCGSLNPRRDNVIVNPTSQGGHHTLYEGRIGPERALDPSKYFIIFSPCLAMGYRHRPVTRQPLTTGHGSPK